MNKPYVICHNTFDNQAWMVGRITMEKDFTEGKKPELVKPSKPIKREVFIGDKDATSAPTIFEVGEDLPKKEAQELKVPDIKNWSTV